MQTSRRRRTSARLHTDSYDPKSKSNSTTQTLYIVLGGLGLIVVLFVVYKLLFTSSPSTISSTDDANVLMEDETNGMADGQRSEMMDKFANKHGLGEQFDPKKMSQRMMNKLQGEIKHNDRPFKSGIFGNRKGDPFGKPKTKLSDTLSASKLGKAPPRGHPNQFKDGPFNHMGEGPIFNDLHKRKDLPKLSAEQVSAAMKANAGRKAGGMPFGSHGQAQKDRNKLQNILNEGQDVDGGLRERGHEM